MGNGPYSRTYIRAMWIFLILNVASLVANLAIGQYWVAAISAVAVVLLATGLLAVREFNRRFQR